MVVTGSSRRGGVVLGAIAAVVALTAGCSSTSSGKPLPVDKPIPTSSSATAGASSSAPSSAPVTAPSSAPVTAPSSLPVVGGSTDPFCKELSNGDLSGLGNASGTGLPDVLAKWDKLAAAAPPAIKSDAQAIDQYLHSLVAGTPNPTQLQAIEAAAQHLGVWIASHCR